MVNWREYRLEGQRAPLRPRLYKELSKDTIGREQGEEVVIAIDSSGIRKEKRGLRRC
jgi:hypothetical protein